VPGVHQEAHVGSADAGAEDARRQLDALEPVAGGEVVNLRPGQLEADVRGAEALEHGPNLAVYGQGRATVRPA